MYMVKVDSTGGRNDPLVKHGNFSDEDLIEIREHIEERLENAIESKSNPEEFDIVDKAGIIERPVHEAESGDYIMFWPTSIDSLNGKLDVDSDKLESYFAGGYGVECTVQ